MLQNTISEGNNAVYAPEIIYKEWKWSSGPDCQSHSPRTENELEYSSPKGPEEVPKWKSFWLIGSSLAAAIFGFLLSWNLFYLHKLWRREAVLPKQELEDTNVKLCNRDFEILKLVMTRGLKEEEFLERFRGLVRSPDSFPPDIIVDIFRMRRAFEYAQLEIKGIGNAPLAKKNCEAESTGLKLTNGNLHGKLSSLLLERASRLESPKKETCKSFQEAISPKEAAVVKESLFDQGFNLGGQISADSDDVMDLSPVRPPPPPPPPPPPTPGISSTFCNPNISKPKIILSKKMKRLHWKRLLFDLRKKSEAPHIWQLSSEQKFDKQLLEEHFSHKVKMKISKSVMPGSNLSKRVRVVHFEFT